MRRAVRQPIWKWLGVFLVLFLAWHPHAAHLFKSSHSGHADHRHQDAPMLEAHAPSDVDHCNMCWTASFARLETQAVIPWTWATDARSFKEELTIKPWPLEVQSRAPPSLLS
jgi:hypothetical protein